MLNEASMLCPSPLILIAILKSKFYYIFYVLQVNKLRLREMTSLWSQGNLVTNQTSSLCSCAIAITSNNTPCPAKQGPVTHSLLAQQN